MINKKVFLPYLLRNTEDGRKLLYVYVPHFMKNWEWELTIDISGNNKISSLPISLLDNNNPHPLRGKFLNKIFSLPYPIPYNITNENCEKCNFNLVFPKPLRLGEDKFFVHIKLRNYENFCGSGDNYYYLRFYDGSGNQTYIRFYDRGSSGTYWFNQGVGKGLGHLFRTWGCNCDYENNILDIVVEIDLKNKVGSFWANGYCFFYKKSINDSSINILKDLKEIAINHKCLYDILEVNIGLGSYYEDYIYGKNVGILFSNWAGRNRNNIQITNVDNSNADNGIYKIKVKNVDSLNRQLPPPNISIGDDQIKREGIGATIHYGTLLEIDVTDTGIFTADENIEDLNSQIAVYTTIIDNIDTSQNQDWNVIVDYVSKWLYADTNGNSLDIFKTEIDLENIKYYGNPPSAGNSSSIIHTQSINNITPMPIRQYPINQIGVSLDKQQESNDLRIFLNNQGYFLYSLYLYKLPKGLYLYEIDGIREIKLSNNEKIEIEVLQVQTDENGNPTIEGILSGNFIVSKKIEYNLSANLINTHYYPSQNGILNLIDYRINWLVGKTGTAPWGTRDYYHSCWYCYHYYNFKTNIPDLGYNRCQFSTAFGFSFIHILRQLNWSYYRDLESYNPDIYWDNRGNDYWSATNYNNKSDLIGIFDLEDVDSIGEEDIDSSSLRLWRDSYIDGQGWLRKYLKGLLIWDIDRWAGIFDSISNGFSNWSKDNIKSLRVYKYFEDIKDFAESGNSIPLYEHSTYLKGIPYEEPIPSQYTLAVNEETNQLETDKIVRQSKNKEGWKKTGLLPKVRINLNYGRIINYKDNNTNYAIDLVINPYIPRKFRREWFEDWTKSDFFGDGSEVFSLTFKDLTNISNLKLDLDTKLVKDDSPKNWNLKVSNWDKVKESVVFDQYGNVRWDWVKNNPEQIRNLLYVDDYSYGINFIGARFLGRDIDNNTGENSLNFGTPYIELGDGIVWNGAELFPDGNMTISFFIDLPSHYVYHKEWGNGRNSITLFAMQNVDETDPNKKANYGIYLWLHYKRFYLRVRRKDDGSSVYYRDITHYDMDSDTTDIPFNKPLLLTIVFDANNRRIIYYFNGRKIREDTNVSEDVFTTIREGVFNRVSIFGAVNERWLVNNFYEGIDEWDYKYKGIKIGNFRIFNRVLSKKEIIKHLRTLYIPPAFIINWKNFLKKIVGMDIGQPNSIKRLLVDLVNYRKTYRFDQTNGIKIAFVSSSQIKSGELNADGIPLVPIIDRHIVNGETINLISPEKIHNTEGDDKDIKEWLLVYIEPWNLGDDDIRNNFIEIPYYKETKLFNWAVNKGILPFGKEVYPLDWLSEFTIQNFENINLVKTLSNGYNDFGAGKGTHRTQWNIKIFTKYWIYPNIVYGNRKDTDGSGNGWETENKLVRTPIFLPNLSGTSTYGINKEGYDTTRLERILNNENYKNDRRNLDHIEKFVELDWLLDKNVPNGDISKIFQTKPISLDIVYGFGLSLGIDSIQPQELYKNDYLNCYIGLSYPKFRNNTREFNFRSIWLRFYVKPTTEFEYDLDRDIITQLTPNIPLIGLGQYEIEGFLTNYSRDNCDNQRPEYAYNVREFSEHSDSGYIRALRYYSDIYIGRNIKLSDIVEIRGYFRPILPIRTQLYMEGHNIDWAYGQYKMVWYPIFKLSNNDGSYFKYYSLGIDGRLVDITREIEEVKDNPTDDNKINNLWNKLWNNCLANAGDISALQYHLNRLKEEFGEDGSIAFGIWFYYNPWRYSQSQVFYGLEIDLKLNDSQLIYSAQNDNSEIFGDGYYRYYKKIDYVYYSKQVNQIISGVDNLSTSPEKENIDTIIIQPNFPGIYIDISPISKDDTSTLYQKDNPSFILKYPYSIYSNILLF